MIFIFLIFTYQALTDMYEDSFAMINKNLPSLPLTIFNSASIERTLPLRLTEIRPDNLDSQLFMIRFNYDNLFWLSSVANMNSRSINAHPYFVMRKKPAEPNMTLEYLDDIQSEKIYKIVSEELCLTVEEAITKDNITYYPLTFKECTTSPLQEFVFIPRIALEKFVKKKGYENINKKDVKEAYEILYKKLKIAIKYNGNKNSEDNSK